MDGGEKRMTKWENEKILELKDAQIFREHDIEKVSLRTKRHGTRCTCITYVSKSGKHITIFCGARLFFHNPVTLNHNLWTIGYSVGEDISKGYICKFVIKTAIDLTKHKWYLSEAEILLILSELMYSLSNTSLENFVVRIDHNLLAKAILEECDVVQQVENSILSNVKITDDNRFREILKLSNGVEITKDIINLLQNFQNSNARIKAGTAIVELLAITDVAKKMGVQYRMTLQVNSFNDSIDNQMSVQLVYECSDGTDTVIADGRRYEVFNIDHSTEIKDCGMGLSVYPEEIVKILKTKEFSNLTEVIVCCFSNYVLTEVHKVSKNLWDNNISTSFIKMSNIKSCYTHCLKNKYLWIIGVTENLLAENKVLIMYRKKRFFLKWIVNMENLLSVTKTLLRLEPFDNILLENGIEIRILFRTTINFSFFDKVKYKYMIKEELNNKNYSKEKIVAFVINFDSNFVHELFNKKPKGKHLKQQSSIYDDLLQMELDEKYLIIFACAVHSGEDMVLNSSYFTYEDNKLKLLNP